MLKCKIISEIYFFVCYIEHSNKAGTECSLTGRTVPQIRNKKVRNFGTIKEKEKHHISMLNKALRCKFSVTEKYFLSNENRVDSLPLPPPHFHS